jgi:hypothetical protein
MDMPLMDNYPIQEPNQAPKPQPYLPHHRSHRIKMSEITQGSHHFSILFMHFHLRLFLKICLMPGGFKIHVRPGGLIVL